MRVSTSMVYNIANVSLHKTQSAMNRTNEQISTGKRVLSPADDPVAATNILKLNQQLGRLEQFDKNINIAQNNLELEEATLDSVMNIVQRMNELTVQAGNTGTLTASNYKALAAEVDTRIDELLNLMNTRNASGQYIFGGHQGSTQPFERDDDNFFYRGDQGEKRIQISENVTVPVTDNGRKVFMDIPSAHPTFTTRANPANQAQPPASISVGQVVDEDAWADIYPDDLVITFNARSAIDPAGSNFTVTERSSGKVLVANEPFTPGQEIEVGGVSFAIDGQPFPGTPAEPASLPLNVDDPVDFSATPATVVLTVGGVSETLVLDQPVSNEAELFAALSSTAETVAGSGADRNAARLANLGLTLVPGEGLVSARGENITVRNGNAATDDVFGLDTTGAGTTTENGVPAVGGDRFSVNATPNQGLLTTLSRLSNAMKNVEDNPESKAELSGLIAQTLSNLDNSLTSLGTTQGALGARLNTLDSTRELNLDTKLYSEQLLSDLQDLDYAEASTRLAMESMVFSAAQQSFVKVSQLSLFNFL